MELYKAKTYSAHDAIKVCKYLIGASIGFQLEFKFNSNEILFKSPFVDFKDFVNTHSHYFSGEVETAYEVDLISFFV